MKMSPTLCTSDLIKPEVSKRTLYWVSCYDSVVEWFDKKSFHGRMNNRL